MVPDVQLDGMVLSAERLSDLKIWQRLRETTRVQEVLYC